MMCVCMWVFIDIALRLHLTENIRTESSHIIHLKSNSTIFPLINSGFTLQWFSLERYFTLDNILGKILAPYITFTPRQCKYPGRHGVSKTRCATANWALINKLLTLWANKRPSRDSNQVSRVAQCKTSITSYYTQLHDSQDMYME